MGGAGQTGLRLNNGVNTSLRPSTSNSLAGRTGASAGSLHVPGVGRVTPQHVSNFLSMPNHHNVGGVGGNRTNLTNLSSRTTNINNINSFNRINNTQVTRINNNLNNGFRNNFNRHGFRNGFGFYGYPYFGYGFGSPFFNNWAYGVRGFWNPYGYYGPGYGYGPGYVGGPYGACYWQRQRYWDGYGWAARNVRVCE